MNRRTFVLLGMSTSLAAAGSSTKWPRSFPGQESMSRPVPPSRADDVYSIYSRFVSTQLELSQKKNLYCLIADETRPAPQPPIEEVVPPEFAQGVRRAIIVPPSVLWNDLQQVASDLDDRTKIGYHLENRFAFTSAHHEQAPPVLLINAEEVKDFSARNSSALLWPGRPVPTPSDQERAMRERISKCEDLLSLSPVYFNRSTDLALVHGVDSDRDGWQDSWGVYAKTNGVWMPQGTQQGWFIVQPFAGMN